jgi:thiamine-monophosphate kinase
MEKGQNRTELSALGEFKLIDRLTSDVNIYNSTTIKGVGDDAAVIDLGDEYQVITTDMLLEGVHFDLSYVPLRHLGYKSVAVNVSDIAAMNAIPEQITVGIAVSNRFAVEALDEIYAGIKIACENYNVDLVGGDTTTSRSGLVISITALGRVPKDKIAYRSRAKKGDIICVTGDLGGAYMGLQVLEREKQVFLSNPEVQPELTGKDYIIQRQLKPEARMDLIYELRDLGVIPTAMIDVSDGLASEILHLCRNSKVGARVYEEKIPIHGETYNTAAEFNLSPTTVALNGGEDYELLFTINQADFEKIKHQPDISYIGYISENENEAQLITKSGNVATLTAQGWTHF